MKRKRPRHTSFPGSSWNFWETFVFKNAESVIRFSNFCHLGRQALSNRELCNYVLFPSPSIPSTLNLIINSQKVSSTVPPRSGVWTRISLVNKGVGKAKSR